jgi:hypothetical protein
MRTAVVVCGLLAACGGGGGGLSEEEASDAVAEVVEAIVDESGLDEADAEDIEDATEEIYDCAVDAAGDDLEELDDATVALDDEESGSQAGVLVAAFDDDADAVVAAVADGDASDCVADALAEQISSFDDEAEFEIDVDEGDGVVQLDAVTEVQGVEIDLHVQLGASGQLLVLVATGGEDIDLDDLLDDGLAAAGDVE